MNILNTDIRIYFLLFMIYAQLGWAMEVTCKLIQYKRFINRGFLVGPYCPIYGYGALLITFLLHKYTNDPIILFFMAIIICGTLEYLTSYFMEKVFKARWWDYSQKKFNINGRVCLNTIIPFGILGLVIMYVSNPFFIKYLQMIPNTLLNILFWSLLAIYIADNIVSGIVVRYVKKTENDFGEELDNTEAMTKKIKQVLTQKSFLHRRLINAYPTLQAIKIKIKTNNEKIKKEIKEERDQIQENLKQKQEEIKNKVVKPIKKDKNSK